MDAFDGHGRAVEVNVIGEREFFLDGELFTGRYIDLPYDLAKDFDDVCDFIYDLPTFENGYITARRGRFTARAAAEELVKFAMEVE